MYKIKQIKSLKKLHEYENNYNYLPDSLKNYFDGEVSILIIDKKIWGKGIGKNYY